MTVSTRRRPSARTLIAGIGVAGLISAASLTAAQWTDDATISGEVAIGSFEIVITGDQLDLAPLAPNAPESSTGHVLTNNSTVAAEIDVAIDGFDSRDPADRHDWNVIVTAGEGDETTTMFDGGPALNLRTRTVTLEPGEEIPLELTFEMFNSDPALMEAVRDVSFTFTGTQVNN